MKMKKVNEDALDIITKGLSNPHYFEETRPTDYDITAYCISCGKDPSDKELEREWTSVLIPRLKGSKVKAFQETATMLEKKWKSQKRARQAEWQEERMDSRMRKLLGTLSSSSSTATLSTASLTTSTSNASATTTITTTNTTAKAGEDQDLFFDPSTAETIMLMIAGVEVGTGFRELQCKAAAIVNDRNKKFTLERLPMFM